MMNDKLMEANPALHVRIAVFLSRRAIILQEKENA